MINFDIQMYHGTGDEMKKKLNLSGHRTVTCKIE